VTQPIVIGNATLHIGDCLEILRTLPDSSVDSVVTDPPYGLSREPDMAEVLRHWLAGDDYVHRGRGFMGKDWDSFVPGPAVWRECLRVLKPGGHLLAFFGTRTQDIGTLAIRLAGFEIRDSIAWVYGSGFPKSLDVSKAIDKAAGAEREVIGFDASKYRPNRTDRGLVNSAGGSGFHADNGATVTAPATDAARRWEGWGTALKPALEPITVARKPLAGTVAANVLAYGTGALNIDGCRVGTEGSRTNPSKPNALRVGVSSGMTQGTEAVIRDAGRWPANLIHDGSDEVVALFPREAGGSGPASGATFSGASGRGCMAGGFSGMGDRAPPFYGDTGSAARFFYCAKASKKDRGEGNTHPTVKPTALMRYLCRLVTPPGGLVLDPFSGSGSTGKAAIAEGFRFVGIELSPEYAAIAEARIRVTQPGMPLEAA
jgi:DNA modification methylase